MLWLPISASSAWAMSTQMQMNAIGGSTEMAIDMPCHDMADSDTAPDEPSIKHNCSACGACFTILATGSKPIVHFSSLALASRAALPADDQTVSQTYPPALRPPITS